MQAPESIRENFKFFHFKRFLFALTLVSMLSACSWFQDDPNSSKKVARAFDKYLYLEDIEDLVPLGTSAEDSAVLVSSYLDSWIKQQLVFNKARLNLSEQEAVSHMEQQLEDYRTSLMIYAYHKELIKQKLDTIVSDKKINEYYKDNVENFILKDDIIRVRYLKIPKVAPDLDSARKWCASELEEDIIALEEYCHQYAKSYLLTEKQWILFENLKLELGPEFDSEKEKFIPETMLESEDSVSIYLVYVLDLILKENLAPVEYERKKIRAIILNRRRSELILKMEASTYQEGITKNYFDLYK